MTFHHMRTVFGWVYRYDSPNLPGIVRLLDALKMTLLHHKIDYFMQAGGTVGALLVDLDSFLASDLRTDETYLSIEGQLRELCK